MDIIKVKKGIYTVYKPIGKTPTEVVSGTKDYLELEKGHQYIKKICCSGRLDPMAHGKLLILVNEECKNIPKYNKKDKTYKFSFVVGVSTDTTDVLGLVEEKNADKDNIYSATNIASTIMSFDNLTYQQEYHIFSSNPVIGPHGKKPMFYYARNGIKVNPPKKDVTIYGISINSSKIINKDELCCKINKNLSLVSEDIRGKFRYGDIMSSWSSYFKENKDDFIEYTCIANVSSGTYIRQIVKDIGSKLGVGTLVTDLERTNFDLE